MDKTKRFGFLILCAAGCAMLASCASTGVTRSNSAAAVLDSKTTRLKQFDELLTTLNNNLTTLEQSAGTDPRKPYTAFVSTSKKIYSDAQAIKKDATTLQQQTNKRFEVWQEEIGTIQDQELKEKAMRRREEEIAKCKEIEANMHKVFQAYQPLEGKLKDLNTYLDNDLNPSGITGASKLINVVRGDSEVLQKEIRKMVQEIDKVSAETAPRQPAKAPEPAAEAKADKAEATTTK